MWLKMALLLEYSEKREKTMINSICCITLKLLLIGLIYNFEKTIVAEREGKWLDKM